VAWDARRSPRLRSTLCAIAGLGAALARQRWQHDTVVQGVTAQFDRGT